MGFPPPGTGAKDGVVNYAYSVVLNGKEIGAIQRFTPSGTRAAERVSEIRAATGAKTIALVPGRGDNEIVLERLTLFKNNLLEYFGEGAVPSTEVLFGLIRGGVDIIEVQYEPGATPDAIPSTASRTVVYKESVPQSWSKTIDQGTVLVTESVTCWVTSLERSE